MYYEINVIKNGRHYFATCDRSIVDNDKLKSVYGELSEHFTSDKGYELTVTLRYTKGNKVEMGECESCHRVILDNDCEICGKDYNLTK